MNDTNVRVESGPAIFTGSGIQSSNLKSGERNDHYSITTDPKIAMPLALILDEAEALLLRKHRDYGPENIAQSPFGPIPGLLVRMWDKIARAAHLEQHKDRKAEYESLEDTFLDMLCYSAIGLMVLRGQWPGVKKVQS
jgi:hypothetical protein